MRLSEAFDRGVVRDGAFVRTDFVTATQGPSLCFAHCERYLALANGNANVTAVITTPELAPRAAERLGIVCDDAPMERFYRLHNALDEAGALRPQMPGSGVSTRARIHPSAIVEEGVCVEPGVEVEAMAWVGANSWLRAGALIGVGARIGVEGHFFKRLSGELFRVRHAGGVRIGRGAQVLAGAIVQRAVFADFTEVGADTVLGPGVHLGHGVRIGRAATLAGSVQVAGFTSIGDRAWIGPGAVVANLLTLGDGARVEIGSVVVRSVGAGERVSGNFARPHIQSLRAAARDRAGR